MEDERRAFKGGSSMRRNHFNRTAKEETFKQDRERKDGETRRMEEFRKLCKKEGITSKRLEEYDGRRAKNDRDLEDRLGEINEDTSITNAEKRKRKFTLKRKASTISAVRATKKTLANPMHRLERVVEDKQAQKEAEQKERKDRMAEKESKIQKRKQTQELYQHRTRKGQPVMASRMQCLLDKIQQK